MNDKSTTLIDNALRCRLADKYRIATVSSISTHHIRLWFMKPKTFRIPTMYLSLLVIKKAGNLIRNEELQAKPDFCPRSRFPPLILRAFRARASGKSKSCGLCSKIQQHIRLLPNILPFLHSVKTYPNRWMLLCFSILHPSTKPPISGWCICQTFPTDRPTNTSPVWELCITHHTTASACTSSPTVAHRA